MVWRVEISETAERQLAKLCKRNPKIAARLLKQLGEVRALPNPRSIGKAGQGPAFRGSWVYRSGDYRLECALDDQNQVITLLTFGPRKNFYGKGSCN